MSSIAVAHQPSVTWMIVFPDTRGASGPNAAGASASGRTATTLEVRTIGLDDEEDRPGVLRLDRGRLGNGDERAAGAYERGRTLKDATADHVEHHVGLTDVLEASVSKSTNSSTPRPSARSLSAARPVPITRQPA